MLFKLRPVRCKFCSRLFLLCRSCDRGQSYCSKECRTQSRHEILDRARQKYSHSEKGMQNNCERQRRWRKRHVLKGVVCGETVTDPSSQLETAVVSLCEQGAGFQEISHDGQPFIIAGEIVVSGRVDPHYDNKKGPEISPTQGHRGSHGCCHLCGRTGVIDRKRRRRGRFRWIRHQDVGERHAREAIFQGRTVPGTKPDLNQ